MKAQTAGQLFTPIPRAELEKMIDKRIHLRWAHKGCNWVLLEIKKHSIVVETPKTKKRMEVPITDAVYTRRHQPPK